MRICTISALFLIVYSSIWLSYPTNADAPPDIPADTEYYIAFPEADASEPELTAKQASNSDLNGKASVNKSTYQNTDPLPIDTLPVDSLPDTSATFAADQLIRRVEGVNNMVALTFDDGPYAEKTAEYLAVLDEYNVHATFFMVGQRMQYYPELAQKVVHFDSEIASHSWRHARLDNMGTESIRQDLQMVNDQALNSLGVEINLFRPPYGGSNRTVLETSAQMGIYAISWDVDPQDWGGANSDVVAARVLEQVRPGSIILLHEGRENTLKALPAIISGLREKGLEPVPVSVLMRQAAIQVPAD